MDKILYERELHEPLRKYLINCGFEVRSEVNDCDVVAKKEDMLVVIEMKRHLSFDLLAQAVERQSYADAVYVCVPKPPTFKQDKDWRSRLKVLRQLGLGLLLVGKTAGHLMVEEALTPEPVKSIRSSPGKKKSLEKEFGNRRLDLNIAGSNGVPLVTAYRESALYLVYLINTHGPQTPKALKNLGGHPKKTNSILNVNHYGWFMKNQDHCYTLTEAGLESLRTYAPMIEAFKAEADQVQTSSCSTPALR